jgi:hypothetical protein
MCRIYFVVYRVVVLCRHERGHLFLVCSCFFYQRVLVGCGCIFAVKNGAVDVFEDVYWHHLLIYSLGNLPSCKRTIDDGLMNGPGVSGVDRKELQIAAGLVPASRNGVDAWMLEGGMSWVPQSRVVWGKVSLGQSIVEEATDFSDPVLSDLRYDSMPDAPGTVPQYVHTGPQMYRFFVDSVDEWARTQAKLVSRATTTFEFQETMWVLQEWQLQFESVLQGRYGNHAAPTRSGGVYDGHRPRPGGSGKRHLGSGESRKTKRPRGSRSSWEQGAFNPSNGPSPPHRSISISKTEPL